MDLAAGMRPQPMVSNLPADLDHDVQTRITSLDELKLRPRGDDCVVVIFARVPTELGKRYVLRKDALTIGRSRDNDLVMPSDSMSRRHARIEYRDGDVYVVDEGSTNGTFVNEDPIRVRERRIQGGDQLKMGDTILKFLSGSNVEAQYHEVIFNLTVTDGLTRVANRMHLDNVLGREIPRAQRHERDLAVLMLDIDHFKKINDTYGHPAGDSVLRDLATLLQRRLRPEDKLGRYGGEEFCAILPETSLASAVNIAETLRTIVEGHEFLADDQPLNVTISVGAAIFQSGMGMLDLYKAADEMLYRAKRAGRNRVCASM
jgi:diguanylate cyclase (GGDEF)-like protein